MRWPFVIRTGLLACALLVSPALGPRNAAAAGGVSVALDPEVERELKYADLLMGNGYPDLAEIVIKRIKDPAARSTLKVLRLRGKIALGDFKAVIQTINKERNQNGVDTLAMTLALADGYYAWGKYPEAQSIYNRLFGKYKNGPPPALKKFYLNSGYKYARMLILMGKRMDAIYAYNNMLKALPKKDIEQRGTRRQVMCEMGEMMVKVASELKKGGTATVSKGIKATIGSSGSAVGRRMETCLSSIPTRREDLFRVADKIMDNVMWIEDLWFGKAVAVKAHIRLFNNDVAGAQKILKESLKQLQDIDQRLRYQGKQEGTDLLKFSPLAQVKYLYGEMLMDRAKASMKSNPTKAINYLAGTPVRRDGKRVMRGGKPVRDGGALREFLTVFIKYPTSTWAASAGQKAQQCEDLLRKLNPNAVIKKNISKKDWEKVKASQVEMARSMFRQNQFKKAIGAYLDVLEMFPDGEHAVKGVGELARCYIEEAQPLYAEVTIRYLAERFHANPKTLSTAAEQILGIATMYNQRNMPDKRAAVYDLYFEHFMKHSRAPDMLFSAGVEKLGIRDFATAKRHFQRIVDAGPETPHYFESLSQVGLCLGQLGDHLNEIKSLQRLIAEAGELEEPSRHVVVAKFRLGYALFQFDKKYLPNAIQEFNEVIALVRAGKHGTTEKDRKSNQTQLESSLYFTGAAYSRLEGDPQRTASYRQAAIKSFSALVKSYPASKFAPAALTSMATLYTLDGKAAETRRMLNLLKKDYPTTPEAKNATFSLAMALLKLGKRKQAAVVFAQMFTDQSGNFSDGQILTAGRELMKAEEYEIAIQAFDRLIGAEKRAIQERAMLGLAKAKIETKKYEDGVKGLRTLLKKYPKSSFWVEIGMYMNKGCNAIAPTLGNAKQRKITFNEGVLALKKARRYVKTIQERGMLDLAVARTETAKATAEIKHQNPEAAKAYRGKAMVSYQVMLLSQYARDPQARFYIEEAYAECIPLMVEDAFYQEALEQCNAYLQTFRDGRYGAKVTGWKRRTQARMAAAGLKAAPAGGGGAPPPPAPAVPAPATNAATATAAAPAE